MLLGLLGEQPRVGRCEHCESQPTTEQHRLPIVQTPAVQAAADPLMKQQTPGQVCTVQHLAAHASHASLPIDKDARHTDFSIVELVNKHFTTCY